VTSRLWRIAKEQIVEWIMTGVHNRDWQWVAASHQAVAIKGLTLLWTKDGTITDCHVYFDMAVVEAQFGAGPKELAELPRPALPTGVDQTNQEGDNAAVVKTALDALESIDEPVYLDYFTDDIEITTLERDQPLRGKDGAVKAYFKAIHKALGGLDTTIQNRWSVSQFGIVEYAIFGEQLGAIGWVPQKLSPQKAPHVVKLQVADVAEIRDGKIARVWRYDNPGQIASPGP
jgi:ketosteroid isomerase-like protein